MGEGIIPVDFASGGTAVGLTIAKLIEARRRLRSSDASMKGLTLTIGPTQEVDLYSQIRIVQAEFNSLSNIRDGIITDFLDFDVRVQHDVPHFGSVRNCVAFAKPRLIAGKFEFGPAVVIECKDLDND